MEDEGIGIIILILVYQMYWINFKILKPLSLFSEIGELCKVVSRILYMVVIFNWVWLLESLISLVLWVLGLLGECLASHMTCLWTEPAPPFRIVNDHMRVPDFQGKGVYFVDSSRG